MTICEEGKETLVRLGATEALQAGDCIVGIYTSEGNMACASCGTYVHAATGVLPLKYTVKYFTSDPTVGIKDGDIFFCNEAIMGGIHNPDNLVWIPLFHEGKLVCFVLSASHVGDTGGTLPGGMIPSAKTRYEEGLKVPPIKVGGNFRIKTDILNFFNNMVRDERGMSVDTAGKATACYKVRERLLELIAEKGVAFVKGVFYKMMMATIEEAKKRVEALLDGTYQCVIFYDNNGVDPVPGPYFLHDEEERG